MLVGGQLAAGSPGRRCASRTAKERRVRRAPLQSARRPAAPPPPNSYPGRCRCRTAAPWLAVAARTPRSLWRPGRRPAVPPSWPPARSHPTRRPRPGCARRHPWEHLFCRDSSLQLTFSQTPGSSRADRPGRHRRMGPMATGPEPVPSALPGPGRLTCRLAWDRARRSGRRAAERQLTRPAPCDQPRDRRRVLLPPSRDRMPPGRRPHGRAIAGPGRHPGRRRPDRRRAARLDEEGLAERVAGTRVFARTSPEQKLRLVGAWKAPGRGGGHDRRRGQRRPGAAPGRHRRGHGA